MILPFQGKFYADFCLKSYITRKQGLDETFVDECVSVMCESKLILYSVPLDKWHMEIVTDPLATLQVCPSDTFIYGQAQIFSK